MTSNKEAYITSVDLIAIQNQKTVLVYKKKIVLSITALDKKKLLTIFKHVIVITYLWNDIEYLYYWLFITRNKDTWVSQYVHKS